MPDKIIIPLETVRDVANYLLMHPDARLLEIMGEFDLTQDEAIFALATARIVIADLERERRGR